MRELIFKMERPDLVKAGDIVDITEGQLPSSWFYTAEPAVAMSENIPLFERLKSKQGKVVKVEASTAGFYLTIQFDEDDPKAR